MRRIILWLAATVTIVVLLFGYRTSTDRGGVGPADPAIPGPTPGVGTVPTPTVATTATNPTTHRSGRRHAGRDGKSRPTSGTTAAKTYTGQTVETSRGPIEVRIAVRSSKIIHVGVPVHPASDPRSVQINDYAIPLLVRETVSAQGARIDMVSGATITSEGYRQSLQSALDQANLR